LSKGVSHWRLLVLLSDGNSGLAETPVDGAAVRCAPAVGLAVGIPKRQTQKPEGPKDYLDKLMDSPDALDI
jgi:hypothetical protein